MRPNQEQYDKQNNSMLNNAGANHNEISTFLQNNYGSFKSVQGPSATVANSDLKGIGQLAAELA